jgi:hypothetical protein
MIKASELTEKTLSDLLAGDIPTTECCLCRKWFRAGEEFATCDLAVWGKRHSKTTVYGAVLCEGCMDKHGDGYILLGHGGSGRKFDFSTMKRVG